MGKILLFHVEKQKEQQIKELRLKQSLHHIILCGVQRRYTRSWKRSIHIMRKSKWVAIKNRKFV